MPRPSRDFAPAGDLLSCVDKKVGKEASPDRTARSKAAGALRCSGLEGPRKTRAAALCSNSCAESEVEVRCANALKALRCSAALKGARRIPRSARLAGLAVGCCGCSFTPLWRSREAQDGEARAQRASTTDFARLSERSVAKRVPREPHRSSIAGDPSATRRGDGTGATLCLLSGRPENRRFRRSQSRSPAGANSRLGLTRMPTAGNAAHGQNVGSWREHGPLPANRRWGS